MALEKGDVNDLGKDDPNETLKKVQATMEIMQKELLELRSKNVPREYSAPGGMTPEQWEKLISTVSAAAKEKPESQKLSKKMFVDERDIDVNDFDKEGVLFCAYSTGYLIVDDVRQGFPVLPPFGNEIFFKFHGQTKSRNSMGKEVLNTYCVYQSRSKREQKWLREHRYFGIKFFESATEALSTNAERAQKLARFVDATMSMEQDQIVSSCMTYGVSISGDMKAMRILLANKMLDATEDVGVAATKKMIDDLEEERVFLENPNARSSQRK